MTLVGRFVMKDLKRAYILNICIFALEVFSIGWMWSGLSGGVLTASKFTALKFFTVDSNILMGIAALAAFIEQNKILKGKKANASTGTAVFKLSGTVSVTLTMLITMFFLAPNAVKTTGFFSLFAYSNFFLHLVNPVLSIIVFVCFEKSRAIPFRHTFTGTIPLVLYAVYYIYEVLTHMTNGIPARGYDWYGFFIREISSVFIVLPILLLLTYGISFVLWKLNRS